MKTKECAYYVYHRNSQSETVLKWRRVNNAQNGARALQAKRSPSEKAMK